MDSPYYWLNDESRVFLERGYLLPGDTPEKRVRFMADTAESILKIKGFADKFEKYMSYGWYSLSTPIWSNYGLDRGLPISCFGIDIQDDMSDILRSSSEIGMMAKYGGGTAGNFSNIRPRGSEIKNNGASSGSVHFMDIFQTVANTVNQGSARRGHFAAYLSVDHKDINEFLECRSEGSKIQDISLAVTIPEGWMQGLINRDKEKEEIWVKIIKKRYETGYPYILFEDNVNKYKPKVYKDLNLNLKTSQMCVTGDQLVPTLYGIKSVKELYDMGTDLFLFDNKNIVKSSPMKMIKDLDSVYKITLSNGLTHTVTRDHKINVYNRYNNTLTKQVSELSIGDKVRFQTKKGVFGDVEMEDEAYLLGLYQSDGTHSNSSIMIDLWENDFDLIDNVESIYSNLLNKYNYSPRYATKGGKFVECSVSQSKVKKVRLTSAFLKEKLNFKKGEVPSWVLSGTENTQWSYIKGLLQADGTVYVHDKSKSKPIQLSYADVNIDFLRQLQIMFLNLGLSASIRLLKKSGNTLMPDGKGGKKLYATKDVYRLIVGNKSDCVEIEKHTSFLSRKGVYLEDRVYKDNTKKASKIVNIEYIGEEPVYCVNVYSDSHLWSCNGIITHNCSEILEYVDNEKSFTCCLSSMNLLHFDEWKDTDAVEVLTYFLDTVYTLFINRAKNIPFFEKAIKFAEEHRSIGIGALGYHSYLQSKMIPFESMQAKLVNSKMFKLINEKSLLASKELAKLFGEPLILKGTGERFSTRLAVAPTTSSSFILGQVSPSIEPLNSNYFTKDLAKGKFAFKNPSLKLILQKHGKDDEQTWHSILLHGGSVQHLKFLTETEKLVFKTFGEISQLEIIQQAAARQKFIDQSQSLNLMIHPDTPVYEVHALLIEAWKLGIKTLYYQRSANVAQEVGRSLMTCVSCES